MHDTMYSMHDTMVSSDVESKEVSLVKAFLSRSPSLLRLKCNIVSLKVKRGAQMTEPYSKQ